MSDLSETKLKLSRSICCRAFSARLNSTPGFSFSFLLLSVVCASLNASNKPSLTFFLHSLSCASRSRDDSLEDVALLNTSSTVVSETLFTTSCHDLTNDSHMSSFARKFALDVDAIERKSKPSGLLAFNLI